MVQLKDSIAVSRMHFTHAPLQRLGPRSYLLYSSASMHSRGKTLVIPRWRQFLALQLSFLTNFFYKEMNFLLMELLKNLEKLWMLLFPCPGTIPVSSCRSSCQTSCCAPPSSGCATVASSCLSTAPTAAPTLSCSVDPAPSPSESGRGTRMPHLEARDVAADRWTSTQVVLLPPSGSCLQTLWFLCLLYLRRRQVTVQELFFRSWTGFLHALDRWCHPSLHSSGTCAASGHLLREWTSGLSSSRSTLELRGSPVETWLHPW